jgi:hypothetical protein
MKNGSTFVVTAVAGLFLAVVPALGHHSFATEYDRDKPVTLTGSVTRLEWINPHARFHMDVKDDKGGVANWEIEMGSPAGLLRLGWTRNSLKYGQVVVVTGFLAKDGTNLANSTTVTLDGQRLFSGSSSENSGNPSPTP